MLFAQSKSSWSLTALFISWHRLSSSYFFPASSFALPRRMKRGLSSTDSDSQPTSYLTSSAEPSSLSSLSSKNASVSFYDQIITRASLKEQNGGRLAVKEELEKEWCSACEEWVSASSFETHKRSNAMHLFAVNRGIVPSTTYAIPPSNRGYQIMKSAFGWDEEEGLGSQHQVLSHSLPPSLPPPLSLPSLYLSLSIYLSLPLSILLSLPPPLFSLSPPHLNSLLALSSLFV